MVESKLYPTRNMHTHTRRYQTEKTYKFVCHGYIAGEQTLTLYGIYCLWLQESK